jgi:3',5'-cyclic AMP phosphodiesterase CpdA
MAVGRLVGSLTGGHLTWQAMTFTIAHITDPHLSPAPPPLGADFRLKRFMGYINWKRGRERLNDMAMLERLVADLRGQRPDHVAVTGDLVNIGMAEEFRRAAIWMQTLGDPADVSFVPGNHDAYVRPAMPLLAGTFAKWTMSDSGASTFPYLRVRGDIAIIGLTSGVPTGPLMASGKLGARQLDAFAALLDETSARHLCRVVLIHHPPLSKGAPPLRGLTDAAAFERVIRAHGAEAILHGHTHKQLVRSLPSAASKTVGGRVPVLGAPSAAAATHDPRYRAAYHLVRLQREGEFWRVGARVRGLALDSEAIGEREALVVQGKAMEQGSE